MHSSKKDERKAKKKVENEKYEHDVALSNLLEYDRRVRAAPMCVQAIALEIFLRHEQEEEW